MEHRSQVAEFLRSRRARITPEQAGLIGGGGHRRMPGLRREEVALLAGVSVEYYARMERGSLAGVSLEVLDSLARALHLSEAETEHLANLAQQVGTPPPRRRPKPADQTVKPTLQRFLDAVAVPMWVRDRHLDFITANPLGRALFAPIIDDPASRGNTARFAFLSPAARDFFPDWEHNADDMVATIRLYYGQDPQDEKLTDLIDELLTKSDAFQHRWARHDVRHHRTGRKRIHHPIASDLELFYEAMALPANPNWFMFAFTATPGSPSEQRLRLLNNVAAPSGAQRHINGSPEK